MKAWEIKAKIEELAPPFYAEEWDNIGLLIGDEEKEIERIYIALDATDEIVDRAIQMGADMLITHHPMIWKGLKKIVPDDFIGKRVIKLIQSDMVYYAAHTNYDIAPDGMGKKAAERIKLSGTSWLEEVPQGGGIGKVGMLPQPMGIEELADHVKKVFDLEGVTVFGALDRTVERIAVSPGSGRREIPFAIQKGAEVLITGDIDHHDGIDAGAQGIAVIDAGHYGLEKIFVEDMQEFLQKACYGIECLTAEEKSPYRIL